MSLDDDFLLEVFRDAGLYRDARRRFFVEMAKRIADRLCAALNVRPERITLGGPKRLFYENMDGSVVVPLTVHIYENAHLSGPLTLSETIPGLAVALSLPGLDLAFTVPGALDFSKPGMARIGEGIDRSISSYDVAAMFKKAIRLHIVGLQEDGVVAYGVDGLYTYPLT